MKTVLLVDDELLVRVGLKSLLDWEAEGYRVLGDCGDAESAMDFLEKQKVDFLLTDLYMTPTDGFDLIRKVRERQKDMGIIVLSCHNDFSDVQKAVRCGADDYIFKLSLNREELLSALHRVEEKRHLTESSDPAEGVSGRSTVRSPGGSPARDAAPREPEQLIPFLEEQRALFEGRRQLYACSFFFEFLGKPRQESPLETVRSLLQSDGGLSFILNDSLIVIRDFGDRDIQGFVEEIRERASRYVTAPLNCGYSQASDSTTKAVAAAVTRAVKAEARFYGTEYTWEYSDSERQKEPVLAALRAEGFATALESLNNAVNLNRREEIEESAAGLFDILNRVAPPDINLTRQYLLDMLSAFRSRLNANDLLISELDTALDSGLDTELGSEGGNEDSLFRYIMKAPTLMMIRKRFFLFLERYFRVQERIPVREDIERAKNFIFEHCGEGISQADAAQHINMNTSYFSHLFKKTTGESYTDFLHRMQVERAKYLLVSGRYLVYEVAEILGFSSTGYFSTIFKKVSGKNPQDYIPRPS